MTRRGQAVTRIVAGVDGSEESKVALRWALEEARLRHAELRAVYAWAAPGPRRAAEERLGAMVADAVGEMTGVAVSQVAVEGDPTRVLVEAARDADLLVVGSRRRRTAAGAAGRSISRECTNRAACPVVIVRAADRESLVRI